MTGRRTGLKRKLFEMFHVYVLRSKDKKFNYTGQCKDLKKRISEHNKGKVKSTKPYLPLELVHSEILNSREEAVAKEKFYKSSKGRKIIKKILKKAEMAELVDLSAVEGIES
jgi:putative endonuclease